MQALTRADPDGIVQLAACRDGSVTLHLACARTQADVRMDIARAAPALGRDLGGRRDRPAADHTPRR